MSPPDTKTESPHKRLFIPYSCSKETVPKIVLENCSKKAVQQEKLFQALTRKLFQALMCKLFQALTRKLFQALMRKLFKIAGDSFLTRRSEIRLGFCCPCF